jgi:two-component system sensor histidine kinase KdpD
VFSALLWDYFFEPPIHSFTIAGFDDQLLFGLYLVIALVLGQLTVRIRRQEMAERGRQERAEALQKLMREAAEAGGFDEMISRTTRQTAKVFKAEAAVLLAAGPGKLAAHPAGMWTVPKEEMAVAVWAFENGQAAGRFTANFPTAAGIYAPLMTMDTRVGVLALKPGHAAEPGIHLRNLLDAFAEQIALAINRYQVHEISEKAKLLSESERLSKTLLNSISHEIRTPLAIIHTATAYLLDFESRGFSASQNEMLLEIQEATERLNRLVGRVLEVTRLETGHVRAKIAPGEVSELVQMAEGETRKELAGHRLVVDLAPDLPLVPMDFELMTHTLSNLMSNAAFHTPPGTMIRLEARVEEGSLVLSVADEGPGIPPDSLPHLFEKFYRAPNARTGGTGLGLSLVKGFVEAHGGQVTAENRATGGALFRILLPLNPPAAKQATGKLPRQNSVSLSYPAL